MSSVSNGLYFLTLPLVSVMRVIYRKIRLARYLSKNTSCALSIHQKECRKRLGCALYIRCALSIEKYGISTECCVWLNIITYYRYVSNTSGWRTLKKMTNKARKRIKKNRRLECQRFIWQRETAAGSVKKKNKCRYSSDTWNKILFSNQNVSRDVNIHPFLHENFKFRILMHHQR